MVEMDRFLRIMVLLRRGCPWDGAQTHESLKRYLVEEAYEVLEAIDAQDPDALCGELGDLLFQVVFHCAIADEDAQYDFNDVVKRISDKMIQRHPHVFKNSGSVSAEEVQRDWEKNKYKKEQRRSVLSGIPKGLPALLKAQRLQEKAASVGFEWDDPGRVLEKLQEELNELKQAFDNGDTKQIQNEYGDVLFNLVNLGRFLDVISEDALNHTNQKFFQRFAHIEAQYNNDVDKLQKADLETLEKHWENSKQGRENK